MDDSENVTASAAVRQQPVKPRRRRKKLPSREQGGTSQEEPNQEKGLPGNQTAAASFTVKTELQEQVIMPAAMAQPPAVSTNVFHDCTAFEAFGLQQPFTVCISSNVLMLMDFHGHLCTSEVAGYLGGTYDPTTKNLEVIQVFPCRCELNSSEQGAEMEREIQSSMATKGLQVMGWYHSHPASEPKPSQNDVFAQKSYQGAVQLAETQEEPCVGLIISPNHGGRLEETKSAFAAFWVLMVQHDGIKASPMQLQYSITWEQYLTQDVVDEMNALATYYKNQPDSTNFRAVWKGDITFMQKLKMSLAAVQPKFPQENSDQTFMSYIEQLVLQ